MILRSVVLPQPLGPRITSVRPSGIVRLRSRIWKVSSDLQTSSSSIRAMRVSGGLLPVRGRDLSPGCPPHALVRLDVREEPLEVGDAVRLADAPRMQRQREQPSAVRALAVERVEG